MGTQQFTFEIMHASGISSDFKGTLHAAKIEATKQMSHGGGNVAIFDEHDNLVCTRKFWENLNTFGWGNWTTHN